MKSKVIKYLVSLNLTRDKHLIEDAANRTYIEHHGKDSPESHIIQFARSRLLDLLRPELRFYEYYGAATLDDSEKTDSLMLNRCTAEFAASEKLREQRQLISQLLEDADARTTAIVQAWLSSDKPSYSSIGEDLGIHKQTVKRVIQSLRQNFCEDKYGHYTEYLSA